MSLQYIENNENGIGIRLVNIKHIHPVSSGTIANQKKIFDPMGLSLVAIIQKDRKIFSNSFEMIQRTYNFKVSPNLHLTVLGLFNDKRKSSPNSEKLVTQSIEKYFIDNTVESFHVKFNKIRPGTRYKEEPDEKGNRQQMDEESDGTVFANGDILEPNCVRLKKLSESIGKWLTLDHTLDGIFPSIKPKFNAIWCTLGYFLNDFSIKDRRTIEEIFNSDALFDFHESVLIKNLSIARFKTKDLEGAETLWETHLE